MSSHVQTNHIQVSQAPLSFALPTNDKPSNDAAQTSVRAWFGGSFDPVHTSHLAIASHVHRLLSQNSNSVHVSLLPTAGNPLKTHQTPPKHRLAMLETAVSELNAHAKTENAYPAILIDPHEITQPPPVYTIDSVRYFRDEYPNDSLIFVMGLDSLLDLPKWKDGDKLLDFVHLWVLMRQGMTNAYHNALNNSTLNNTFNINELPSGIRSRLGDLAMLSQHRHGTVFLDSHPIAALSSSEIREHFYAGNPNKARTYLIGGVYDYIVRHGLYRQSP